MQNVEITFERKAGKATKQITMDKDSAIVKGGAALRAARVHSMDAILDQARNGIFKPAVDLLTDDCGVGARRWDKATDGAVAWQNPETMARFVAIIALNMPKGKGALERTEQIMTALAETRCVAQHAERAAQWAQENVATRRKAAKADTAALLAKIAELEARLENVAA